MTLYDKPGSDGDVLYDNNKSYAQQSDRWGGPISAEEWAAVMESPTNLMPYEVEDAALDALLDDHRDHEGELQAEHAIPFKQEAA